jgi:acetylornithine deacetylase/succinyl-diaminopimelate desuccinylase-like protein
VLEGGQGFTPSHSMADVQARLAAAAKRGVQKYCKHSGRVFDERMVEVTFDRLHNDAYADPPDSTLMEAFRGACAAIGQSVRKAMAWEASCDARIYHHKGHPAVIFGAGSLRHAHADTEHVDIAELQKALAISTLATWSMIA